MTAIFTLGHNARTCATAKIPHHNIFFLSFLSFFFFFLLPEFFLVKLVQIVCKGKFELLFMQFIKGDSLTLTVIFSSSSDSIENAK